MAFREHSESTYEEFDILNDVNWDFFPGTTVVLGEN